MSKVSIMNVALGRLGQAAIADENEVSAAATAARAVYDPARRAVLRDFRWNFALRVESLARLSTTPPDYAYAYALPSGCLKALRLRRPGNTDDSSDTAPLQYVIRGKTLFTDVEDAVLEYTFNEEDTDQFDSLFEEALTYKLASELAMPLAGKPDLMNAYMNAYTNLVRIAADNSSSENARETEINPYVEAR